MNLIKVFTEHRLAANLGMIVMLLAGLWAITAMRVQLNPDVEQNVVEVNVTWRGASSEDVEKLVTVPLEQQLRTLSKLDFVRSFTRDAFVSVEAHFEPETDLQRAIDDVKQRVSQIRSLPVDIEPPVIYSRERRDLVSAVIVTGLDDVDELIPTARDMERELLARGIDHVDFQGLPEEEIAIQVGSETLLNLGLDFNELGAQVRSLSQDAPAGTVGSGQLARQLRSLDQRRAIDEFNDLPVYSPNADALTRLGDIATVERRGVVDQPYSTIGGQPAIALFARRNADGDSLEAAETLNQWLEEKRETLPSGVSINLFLEAWTFIRDELSLIINNGLFGLALVIVALMVFLQLRVAFWVMVGIPVTFFAALFGFYYMGGTINAISLIGIVMALGIVVDDAIVVGEQAQTELDRGLPPAEAASTGARKMLAPVIASSLTTLCAFTPLLAQDGAPIKEIPLIMLWVITASLVECFLILPGHLRHAFEKAQAKPQSERRQQFNAAFIRWREERFRPLVRHAMANGRVVIVLAFAMFLIPLTAWITGWIKQDLSLSLDFEQLRADVRFVTGATDAEKTAYMRYLEDTLAEVDEASGDGNVVAFLTTNNRAVINNQGQRGNQFASISVELVSPEKRDLSADEIANRWLREVERSPIVDFLNVAEEKQFWADFSILLKGADAATLKLASDELIKELHTLEGVSNLRDDLPWGKEQWILKLTTAGRALGLSTGDLGRQLRSAYDGHRIQIFQEEESELEVRLILPESERNDLAKIGQFPIKVPSGAMVPLSNVAIIEGQRGIDTIRHHDTERSITVRGDVDMSIITGGEVIAYFDEKLKDALKEKYGIATGLDGKSLAEAEAESDFGTQFLIVLALIYVVLAAVFSSWTWPIAVMLAIPLGLTGALLGHMALGLVINPMSMLGLFTLTGIIVNDSIVLVSAYRRNLDEGIEPARAIEDAVCSRLRPVLLTSVTTIAGLFPLLLEQAPIAAMFKPLAAAICFGMAYGTLLVLFVIPVLLVGIVRLTERFERGLGRAGSALDRWDFRPLTHRKIAND